MAYKFCSLIHKIDFLHIKYASSHSFIQLKDIDTNKVLSTVLLR